MRFIVLMSTYNGALYLREQVESILMQLPSDGLLMIRDDGSTDRTVDILREFEGERVALLRGQNIGFASSFFELMRLAPRDGRMYMFSDQDDVWLPDKIERAWSRVSVAGRQPFLYCSNTLLVDDALKPLGVGRKAVSEGNLVLALSDNQVTGCTVAFNLELLSLALPLDNFRGDIHFHDWWLYVVSTAFGSVFCDPVPSILYRQHAGNLVGSGAGLSRYFRMLAYVRRRSWLISMGLQARAFRASYGMLLTEAQVGAVNVVSSPDGRLRRWSMLLSLRLHRGSVFGEVLFRLMLLLDWRS